ncbi:MAG: tRNA pseudouridine(38-40) synthase TruA [Phycisphaerae bacterium]|nr:tRNA pseudouridine(38-40) synthase TruA [Phycisphaerae bacterium]
MAERNIKLTISYDGTRYHGWQRQRNADTIEQRITDALQDLTGWQVELRGSSRTDAGVHALHQVANVHLDSPIPTSRIKQALNHRLPDDITILEVVEVPMEFDAVTDAVRKQYRYTIFTGSTRQVMQVRFSWHRPGKLDAAAMNTAAQCLVGTHDFKSFASAADRRQCSVRTISFCSVVEPQADTLQMDIEADGFLYNMVRNIMGTLVEIGRGRWPVEKMAEILAACDRTAAGPLAPACGLCLMKIDYETETRP